LAALILATPPGRRGAIMQCAISFRPNPTLEASFAVGPLRAAFANYWEDLYGSPTPVTALRAALEPPVRISTVLEFNKLNLTRTAADIDASIKDLVQHLVVLLCVRDRPQQLSLFRSETAPLTASNPARTTGVTVTNLQQLIATHRKFATIYADPPWAYDNEASRAAAVNHYPTLALEEIVNEPVQKLAADDAHLHLWTTNGFLPEAFKVIDAWGFRFKSCLVWIKGDIGMGNYWRMSHEFLLLGVRGSLTFRDRTLPSWILADRTAHSRKPGAIRALIERVSPGPYLELYGREELPDSDWTVYGNQVEKRLF
jgi:N6-adenosine-specific RNA methylase IME4